MQFHHQQQEDILRQRQPNLLTASTTSADIPFSNTLNTHCNICSLRISEPDINILQPCFCGPFHGYCITNLELQARDSQKNKKFNVTNASSNPQLKCPTCAHPVASVSYDFANNHPRSSRPPFTTKPQQPSILPMAISDTRPISRPIPTSRKPSHPPASHPYPQSWPANAYSTPSLHTHTPRLHENAPFTQPIPVLRPSAHVPPSTLQPPQSDYKPTAPPASCDSPLLFEMEDSFPRTPHYHNIQPTSNSPSRPDNNNLHLPSPYHAVPPSPSEAKYRRRAHSNIHPSRTPVRSPDTVIICKSVNEHDVRNGVYGDDVYKAYIEGKAAVLGSLSGRSKARSSHDQELNVKVEMDLHLYHHYTPATMAQQHVRRAPKEKEKRKIKATEKTWWRSPRSMSKLDSRDDYRKEERSRGRGVPSRR